MLGTVAFRDVRLNRSWLCKGKKRVLAEDIAFAKT